MRLRYEFYCGDYFSCLYLRKNGSIILDINIKREESIIVRTEHCSVTFVIGGEKAFFQNSKDVLTAFKGYLMSFNLTDYQFSKVMFFVRKSFMR